MSVNGYGFDDEITEGGASPLREERYVMKLVRLEPSNHPEYGPGVLWVFNVADGLTKKPVKSADGSLYEFFQTTGTKINVPKDGLGSKQFRMASALLGRRVRAGESANAVAEQIVGKYFEPLLALNKNGNLGVASAAPIGTYFKNWVVPAVTEPTQAVMGESAAPTGAFEETAASKAAANRAAVASAIGAGSRDYDDLFGDNA